MASWGSFALVCAALSACQSTTVDFQPAPEDSTLGELAYAVALSNARHQEVCSLELQGALAEDRALIVTGVDAILTDSVVDDLPRLMSSSVLPALDGGNLETLLDASANSLATLVDDQLDPDRKGLAAVSQLLDSSRLLQDQHVLELLRVVTVEPRVVDALHSVAIMATLPDPIAPNTSVLASLMQAVSQGLASEEAPSVCTGLDAGRAAQRLLETDGFETTPVAGDGAWVAKVDSAGNAEVATASSPDSLPPPFGFGDGYDGDGRRLSSTGTLLYRYYDAKHTALAHVLRLAGEAAEAGLVFDAARVLDAALGTQQACPATAADCYAYAADGAALHRFLFTLLEVAKYDKPVLLLQTWRDLVDANPRLAEDVLVAAGRVIKALEDAQIDVEGPELVELVETFLPVVSDIFQIQGAGGVAMPRLLMELIRDLGSSARDFPNELAISIEHTTLIKDQECSAEEPSPTSPKVDFSRRRFFFDQGVLVDNRSSIERSIELLDAADCGSVPFTGGKTVSHVIIDLMSRLAPDTVCNLINNLLGVLGVTGSIGEAVVDSALFVVGCRGDNDVSAADLFVLDDLAKSGALDFYLPVAKSFREAGQMPALIAVFSVMARDLQGDEDTSSNTASALRPMLPVLADIMRSGAMDPFFDLNEMLVSIPAVDGQGTMADVLVDSLARLLEDRLQINTVNGVQRTSLAAELVASLGEVLVRVNDGGASDALDRVSTHVSGYLTRTVVDGEELRLRDQSLVPLLASSLAFLTEAADLPSTQFQCYLNEYQGQLDAALESPALASLLRAALVIDSEGLGEPLQELAVSLLRPVRGDVPIAPSREILRIAAELVQSPVEVAGVLDLANALSPMLDPDVVGTGLITELDTVLSADEDRVIMRLLSGALGPAETPASTAPLYRLFDAAAHYAAIDQDNQCVLVELTAPSPEQLEDSVRAALRLLREPDSLLNTMLDMLRKRRGN